MDINLEVISYADPMGLNVIMKNCRRKGQIQFIRLTLNDAGVRKKIKIKRELQRREVKIYC